MTTAAARTGNWFLETNLVIARLDKLSRNEDVQDKLKTPDCRWDLIVCDEAHKMSATFFGGEIKYTKRYKLGQLLSTLTRHFLLMTATPHNGKEEDFQLFMALLDGDRLEGRFRDGVHAADVSDLMRRMVKESLLKFDATPLFPERIAHTVPYKLSDGEAQLYKAVTDYVREEFNRAEALQNDKRAGTVGFALTILQRRLACLSLHGTMRDPAFVRFLEKIGQENLASFGTRDFLVLDLVHREQVIPEVLKPRLLHLREQGIVETIGRGRGARYLLSRRFYASIGQPGTYTRRRGLDRDANKALLLKHIEDNARSGSNLEELQQVLTNLSRFQVQTLVRELKGAGLIRKVGEVRWARWFPAGKPDDENTTH